MSINKKQARLHRARRARCKIKELRANRLSVYRSAKHIYAQVIDPAGQVLASASTLDKLVAKECGAGGNVKAAVVVGKHIAERAVKAGVSKVAFDRSGFKYHGRVRALAESAREAGLEF